ncbi:MAG TPA: HIT family protein [Methylomirabilota bacterium]|jgi:histidine triad (HIT) family protein|nr:HIT family protein [Methylomirabilota bacterium]
MRAAGSSRSDDGCAFCRVVRGEATSHIVFQDDISVGFLDHRPLFRGHCLLAPREHVATLADLPAPLVGPFFTNVQLLSRAMESGLQAEGSFVAVNNRISQSVPHLHVHVVPRRHQDGLRGFFWPRQRYKSEEEMTRIRSLLRAAIEELSTGRSA